MDLSKLRVEVAGGKSSPWTVHVSTWHLLFDLGVEVFEPTFLNTFVIHIFYDLFFLTCATFCYPHLQEKECSQELGFEHVSLCVQSCSPWYRHEADKSGFLHWSLQKSRMRALVYSRAITTHCHEVPLEDFPSGAQEHLSVKVNLQCSPGCHPSLLAVWLRRNQFLHGALHV